MMLMCEKMKHKLRISSFKKHIQTIFTVTEETCCSSVGVSCKGSYQSVQQHLTQTDEVTLQQLFRETITFLVFQLLWPFFLFWECYQFVKKSKNSFRTDLDLYVRKIQEGKDAIYRGNIHRIEMLVNKRRLDVSKEESLFTAVEHNQLSVVKYFVLSGINLSRENTLHHTPLIHSVIHNRTDIVDFLLKFDPSQLYQKDSLHGRTAVDFCANSRGELNLEMLKLLVKHGADLNLSPDLLLTAAHSGGENSEDVIRFILQCNPSSEMLNRTCRYRQRVGVHKNTCVFLEIVKTGKLRSLTDVLHHPIDINCTDERGRNSLDILHEFTSHNPDISINIKEALRNILLAAGLQTNLPSHKLTVSLQRDISLQNVCRQKIRRHLFYCTKEQNLFLTVTKVPLPPGGIGDYLRSYLLYHMEIN